MCIRDRAYGETWGLAVNEALACGRPVLVSDRVGCAEDVVDESCGRVFPFDAPLAMVGMARELLSDCLLYTSPSPRDRTRSRMPSSA